jgi:hypothetical protein
MINRGRDSWPITYITIVMQHDWVGQPLPSSCCWTMTAVSNIGQMLCITNKKPNTEMLPVISYGPNRRPAGNFRILTCFVIIKPLCPDPRDLTSQSTESPSSIGLVSLNVVQSNNAQSFAVFRDSPLTSWSSHKYRNSPKCSQTESSTCFTHFQALTLIIVLQACHQVSLFRELPRRQS